MPWPAGARHAESFYDMTQLVRQRWETAARTACAAAAGIRHCVTGCSSGIAEPLQCGRLWLCSSILASKARLHVVACCTLPLYWLQGGTPGRLHPQHLIIVLNHVDGDGVLARKILEPSSKEGLHKEEARQPEDGGSAVLVPALQPHSSWSGAVAD